MKRAVRSLLARLDLAPLTPGASRFFVSALLGAVSVLGFAPFYFYPLPVATLSALAWLWSRCRSAGQALSLGLGFGLGYFLTGTSWVYVSLHDFGGMGWPIAGFATAFFCSYLALFPAAAGWLFARAPVARWARLCIVFPAGWSLMEWMRGWLFTGFPWIAVGYSQSPFGPLSGFAAVLGSYGVSLLAVASAGLLCWLTQDLVAARSQPWPHKLRRIITHPALALVLLLWVGGWGLQRVPWTTPMGEPVTVSLLQGNVKQDMKWRPEWVRASMDLYLQLTLNARGRLILLPETALPLFNVDVPPEYLEALARHARENGGDLLLGIPEVVPGHPARYYNSVLSFGSQPTEIYRKYHLVPFGDYFPQWGFLSWIMNALQIPMTDFSRGDPYQQPMAVAGQRVAVNICYEDAFGEEIIRQLPQATMMANFTNDAWWGESIASQQHLQISQMRTQEAGRYMLRATNTGVTAIIDQRGRVVASAPQFVTTVLEGQAQGFAGSTPYVIWGNWPYLTLCVAAFLLIWLRAMWPGVLGELRRAWLLDPLPDQGRYA